MNLPSASISAAVHSPARERLRGIASMIAAVFAFAIMDSLMKRLSSSYGPFQVSSMRCLSSWFLLTLTIAGRGAWERLRITQPGLHLLRGALGVGMLGSFVYAVHRLTMAQTYSLFLAAPLLMTALSVPMLREQVTVRRWLAILAGLGGVLVILHPWSKGFVSVGAALAAAAAAVCYSLSALTVRSLGEQHSSVSIVFWNLALVGVGTGLLSIGDWHPCRGPTGRGSAPSESPGLSVNSGSPTHSAVPRPRWSLPSSTPRFCGRSQSTGSSGRRPPPPAWFWAPPS